MTAEELNSVLFSNLVMQEANIALMLLGKVPHPETGEAIKDLDSAKLFIDRLEMLLVKTNGNLNPEEQALLNQTLMTVRFAFVEEARKPSAAAASEMPKAESSGGPASPNPAARPDAASEEESKKKFVKRY